MANSQNLKHIRSTSEARELGRKGGIASGISRRQKKYFAKTLQQIADLPAVNADSIAKDFPNLGEITNQDALAVALFKKALAGDMRAMDKVLKMTSQTETCDNLDNPFRVDMYSL